MRVCVACDGYLHIAASPPRLSFFLEYLCCARFYICMKSSFLHAWPEQIGKKQAIKMVIEQKKIVKELREAVRLLFISQLLWILTCTTSFCAYEVRPRHGSDRSKWKFHRIYTTGKRGSRGRAGVSFDEWSPQSCMGYERSSIWALQAHKNWSLTEVLSVWRICHAPSAMVCTCWWPALRSSLRP